MFGLVWFYGLSTIVGYQMPNPLNTYILNIYDFVWFYGMSTIVSHLMPNPLYTEIKYMISKQILKITFLNKSYRVFVFFLAHG